jgi:hypothetical protein
MSTWNTELTATSTAVASRSAHDRSDQTSTMAIQRASPTMTSPVRSSGWSGRKIQARANMSNGPTTQFRVRDTPISRPSPAILPALS